MYLYCDGPSHLERRIIECCLNDGVVSEHEDLPRVIA